jgi:predicted kinase
VSRVLEASELALVATVWPFHETGPDGQPVKLAGRSADVLRRQGDRSWRFVMDNPWGRTDAAKGSVMAKTPTLYILASLPGSVKSTLGRLLAAHLGAAYVRIDTIEQGLREVCSIDVQGEGYRFAHGVAADNLRVGISVVADSCNPIALTRREWERVAGEAGAQCMNIEVVCSDPREHRHRVEGRQSTIPGLTLPTWRDVTAREYDAWDGRQGGRGHVRTVRTRVPRRAVDQDICAERAMETGGITCRSRLVKWRRCSGTP